jgi:hypothetical protein
MHHRSEGAKDDSKGSMTRIGTRPSSKSRFPDDQPDESACQPSASTCKYRQDRESTCGGVADAVHLVNITALEHIAYVLHAFIHTASARQL